MAAEQQVWPGITPHGGMLVNQELTGEARAEALARARHLPRVVLASRHVSDVLMLGIGGFSPLTGFMGRRDYERVVSELRLANGVVWSLPITLPVDRATADGLREGQEVALVDEAGLVVGLLELEERFTYDKEREAKEVFRTADIAHPGVAQLMAQGDVYLAGRVWLVNRPPDPFERYQLDPIQTRAAFAERGWRTVVAFQTRNPIHRAHEYLQKCALETVDGLLLHPLVGATKADDVPADLRLRSYEVILERYYPKERVLLAVFPAAMRYAGPREALFHGLTRRNYGCTHFIVGRDAAGVGNYYGPYDAQELFRQFRPEEIGITPVCFENAFYCRACGQMATTKTCPHPASEHVTLSGTKVRELLRSGQLPPPEFTRPEVARILIEGFRNVG